METLILLLLGIVIWIVYVLIEFAIPIILFYFLVSQPNSHYFWILAILLTIWFIARMTIYIIKETKKKWVI